MILNQIIEEKKREVEEAKRKVSLAELTKKASSVGGLRGFKKAISQAGKLNLIAEIKKASPSKGLLRKDFNPVEIAKSYAASGACALSILTDKKFFQGNLSFLQSVRKAVDLPILRKDFIIDEYQIYESVCAGADGVLLIARLLSDEQLKKFCALCARLKLDALCEVHNEEDLDKVLTSGASIIGINNRDLDTFNEDLKTTERLMKKIPKGKIVISESAIRNRQDVKYLQGLGVNAVLIGEAFMRSANIGAKVRELMHDKD
ncbi:MAG: indole-3-glycerol phosphate synthase TrpC [Candidatus Omnitrophota bacterium]|nr:MAG: indole-3-glycerol phosphate synthase TrpC [Candidatus Omnitrophota bacterium]